VSNELLLPVVADDLKKYNIAHKVLECDESFADTAAFCEHYGFNAEQSANTILVADRRDDENIVACVLLADSRLDVNKKVRQLMGAKRASFASAEQTRAASGMEIGGVTVFGLPEKLSIYVDARIMVQPEIVMGGGNRVSKIALPPNELAKLSGVTIVDNLAIPAEPISV
jgi:prolyl-tRNA editing enzyme YbaK/EbsC (Cys-tRNA(Pro) deacylase)